MLRADCAHKKSDFSMASSLVFGWITSSKYLADFIWYYHTMRGSSKFCQMGSYSDVFLVGEGRGIQILLKAGHHRPASETPFKWRFAGMPIMAQH